MSDLRSSDSVPLVLSQIRSFLNDSGVMYRELHHEATPTSEDSARVRGEPLTNGAKALLIKIDDTFTLCVLSAALKVDSGALRSALSAKRSRFATKEELFELTGLVPGCVPPFGAPILPFPLMIDDSITRLERVAFNAGSLTDSVFLAAQDYLSLAKPQRILTFSVAS